MISAWCCSKRFKIWFMLEPGWLPCLVMPRETGLNIGFGRYTFESLLYIFCRSSCLLALPSSYSFFMISSVSCLSRRCKSASKLRVYRSLYSIYYSRCSSSCTIEACIYLNSSTVLRWSCHWADLKSRNSLISLSRRSRSLLNLLSCSRRCCFDLVRLSSF